MNSIRRSLTLKIGTLIILIELLVLIVVGVVIARQFSKDIDSHLKKQILLPASMIAANHSNLDIIGNQETLEQLVGAPVLGSMLISPKSFVILQSIDPAARGRVLADTDGIDPAWLAQASEGDVLLPTTNTLTSISPVFSDDGEDILFFLYMKVASTGTQTQKNELIKTFTLSAAFIIGLTSVIITLSFRLMILDRITAVLHVLYAAQKGHLSARIDEPIRHDEIGDLQHTVNTLISQLEQTVADLTAHIAEQRLTEAALRQSEEKYRDFVEGTDDLIIQLDITGRFIYTNHTAERVYGLSLEELIGRSCFDFIHPDDHARTQGTFNEWIRGHTSSTTFEYRLVSHTGNVYAMLWTVNGYFDQYGNLNYINAIARDITARKQAEEQLQLQSTALEAAANAIVITDPNGSVQWINPAFTRLTGYTLAEISGQNMRFLNSGVQPPEFFEQFWETILGGSIWRGELVNQRKDGTRYLEETSITPVFDASGDITNFVSIKQDVSERKKAENELRERATSLALIAQVGRRATAILALDELLHQSVQLISETFKYYNVVIRLIEDDHVVLRATSLSSLKPLEGRKLLKVGEGITGWVAQHGEPVLVQDVRQDSRYHAELSNIETLSEAAVPIKLKSNIIGVLDTQSARPNAFNQDDIFTLQAVAAQLAVAIENARLYDAAQQEILERRNAEEQLKIYTAELERSNRELEIFAYVSSHDLQEPLRKIQMFGDRLALRYNNVFDDRGRDYLRRMQSAAARMQSLIEDLLAFSRVMTRQDPFMSVDLERILQEVMDDLEPQMITVNGRVQIDPLPIIQGDPTQMRQLFQNLLSNAIKYHKPNEPPLVHVSAKTLPTGHCQIQVGDNGIGFDEKYLDRIFTLFQRLHGRSEYEGTGIGLAVCRRIVERHGGHITAQSTPSVGSTFIVTLPLNRAPAEMPVANDP